MKQIRALIMGLLVYTQVMLSLVAIFATRKGNSRVLNGIESSFDFNAGGNVQLDVGEHGRVRRADVSQIRHLYYEERVNPYSQAEKDAILAKHREYRSNTRPEASNMEHMYWDDELAYTAGLWASVCYWGHGKTNATTNYTNTGQNLWLGGGKPTGVNAVIAWHDNEINNYIYDEAKCKEGKVCGHYTQVVWAKSTRVGCARAYCAETINSTGYPDRRKDVWIFACHYSPGGNIVRTKPFKSGPNCTECQSGSGWCYNNACASSEECSGEICDCRQTCHNCGTLSDECSCNCTDGWHGDQCIEVCEDKDDRCGRSPGWPGPAYCGAHPAIPTRCPLMCGVCRPASVGDEECVTTMAPNVTTALPVTMATTPDFQGVTNGTNLNPGSNVTATQHITTDSADITNATIAPGTGTPNATMSVTTVYPVVTNATSQTSRTATPNATTVPVTTDSSPVVTSATTQLSSNVTPNATTLPVATYSTVVTNVTTQASSNATPNATTLPVSTDSTFVTNVTTQAPGTATPNATTLPVTTDYPVAVATDYPDVTNQTTGASGTPTPNVTIQPFTTDFADITNVTSQSQRTSATPNATTLPVTTNYPVVTNETTQASGTATPNATIQPFTTDSADVSSQSQRTSATPNVTSLPETTDFPVLTNTTTQSQDATDEVTNAETTTFTTTVASDVTTQLQVTTATQNMTTSVPATSTTRAPTKFQDVQVHLVGGSSPAEGRVEVTHTKYGRGTVCDTSWGIKDASVVCKMLGYGAAKEAPGRAYFGRGTGRILLSDVGCTGTEAYIDDCQHRGWKQRRCQTHRKDAGAVCYEKGDLPLELRLVDGTTPDDGRVEVRIGDVWGTICDDHFDLDDAQVICRTLGYKGAVTTLHIAEVPSGNTSYPIFFDNLDCDGDETGVELCNHNGVGNHNCVHLEDAGVECF